MTTVVYYVSGHGLGHSARALGVCNVLPSSWRLIVRTSAPRWFWDGECERPFEWHPQAFDVGAVQLDNLRSDGPASLAAAHKTHLTARAVEARERAFLDEVGASLVISDIPSFPIGIAAEVGLPSILVANFTWVDIYRPYLGDIPPGPQRQAWTDTVEAIAAAYRRASVKLRTPLALPMTELGSTVDIPLIVRDYKDVRAELRAAMGVSAGQRMVLVSTGVYGLELEWGRLATEGDVCFVSYSVPEAARPFVKQLNYPAWRSQDVTAAVDAVVSKAGYGTIAECMAAGTPLIYPPRPSFAEHEALARGLSAWGGGVAVSDEVFRGLQVGEALERAFAMGSMNSVDVGGAQAVLAHARLLLSRR